MDLYQTIVKNLKTGFYHGLIFGAVVLIGIGVKIKFFNSSKNREKATLILSSLGLKNIIPTLNEYELSIASQLVQPSEIETTFRDIAGLESVISSVKSNLILPLLTSRFLENKSRHLRPPKGVLLYGPPGCGKTLLAKAIAKEANTRFINLEIPTLTDKWYGESQKFALAVFTLARKIQPCIIFIDEIDTFLRARGPNDHEVTAMVKAQFMILWDGLNSHENSGVIVLGATNRPFDVDEAILRRMPYRLEIAKPNFDQRKAILSLFLENESLEDESLEELTNLTENFSGSDLKELCRNAISAPVREKEREIMGFVLKKDEDGLEKFLEGVRGVNLEDFKKALKEMEESRDWNTLQNHECKHKL